MLKKMRVVFIFAFVASALVIFAHTPKVAAGASTNLDGSIEKFLRYSAMHSCFLADDVHDQDVDNANSGNWWRYDLNFDNSYNTTLGIILNDDGTVRCDDQAFFLNSLEKVGFSDGQEAWCSIQPFAFRDTGDPKETNGDSFTACLKGGGDFRMDGGNSTDDLVKAAAQFKTGVEKHAKGGSSFPFTATDPMKYQIYLQSFMKGCNASHPVVYDPKDQSQKNKLATNQYVLVDVVGTADGETKTYVYQVENEEKSIPIWESANGILGGPGGAYTQKCSELAAQTRKLSDKYASYVKKYNSQNPGDADKTNQAPDATINGSTDTDDDCVIKDSSALKWIICPLLSIGDNTIGLFQGYIMNFLFTPTHELFDGIKDSTTTFRNFGLGLIVIAGLIMVISQAMGFELFDAYTVKRTMPRLLVAAVGIALAMPLLEFIISLFNDLGILIGNIVINSVGAPANSGKYFSADLSSVLGGIGSGLTVAGATGGIAVGTFLAAGASFGGALALMGTIILSLLIGLFVLAVRQMVILLCVLLAPLAIASYVLPGTQKIWKFWKDALITSLVMFPLIMGFIAAGTAMSIVLGHVGGGQNGFLALIVRFAPYFLLPFAFKLAGGLMSTIFSIANDRSKGLFDRSKNYRAGQRKLFGEDLASKRGRLGNGVVGSAYRRATTRGMGGMSITQRGRQKFAASERALGQRMAAQSMEADGGRATGDDDATWASVRANNRDHFRQLYTQRTGRSVQDADRALGEMEAGLGQRMGTENMQVAAFKARAASSTAYSGDAAGTAERINEGRSLVRRGLLTTADATGAGKGNRARVDINGMGYGAQMAVFGGAGDMTEEQAEAYLDDTLQQADPGDMLAGNPRTITAMAPAMMRNLNAAVASGDQQAIDRALGQIAGVQDNLNRTSPEKAAMFANQVNSQLVGPEGSQITVRQMVQNAATRAPADDGAQTFLEVRKEWSTADRRAGATEPPPEPEA